MAIGYRTVPLLSRTALARVGVPALAVCLAASAVVSIVALLGGFGGPARSPAAGSWAVPSAAGPAGSGSAVPGSAAPSATVSPSPSAGASPAGLVWRQRGPGRLDADVGPAGEPRRPRRVRGRRGRPCRVRPRRQAHLRAGQRLPLRHADERA